MGLVVHLAKLQQHCTKWLVPTFKDFKALGDMKGSDMLVECLHNTYQGSLYLTKHTNGFPRTSLPITKKRFYSVYAIIYGGKASHDANYTQVLIIDDGDSPAFYPTRLFNVTCPHLYGDGWCFTQLGEEYLIDAIMGYEKLVCSPEYFDSFILGESIDALKDFETWKQKIDDAMEKANCRCSSKVSVPSLKDAQVSRGPFAIF